MLPLPGNILLTIVVLIMFLLLLLAGVAVTVFVLSRSGILGGTSPERGVEPAPTPVDDALDIVRRRYAAGEITRDEYEALRHDLET